MIKIERTKVYGWESAIHGMRNPMNSWDKSDSWQSDYTDDGNGGFVVGTNDLNLMKNLIKAGSDHSKFMRMINVTCDITAPLYWWKEFDTYKVGTVRNSCSTMHKLLDKEFSLDDFSHDHLFNMFGEEREYYDNILYCINTINCLESTIITLNCLRENYLATKTKPMKDEAKRKELLKKYWYEMIQLLPSSYNQKATVQLNYAVLRNMYHGRKNHKLDEWSIGFCHWVESLPYSELITMEGK